MELYYKDLISKEGSLEQLVDELMRVVQGTDELAETGEPLTEERKAEIVTRLARIKAACSHLKDRATAGARATDRALHQYPYSFAGVAFAAGLLAGLMISRSRHDSGS
jgi:ElaB/YqjD/DUF883 family membrane-anchored ribosome-binding protein